MGWVRCALVALSVVCADGWVPPRSRGLRPATTRRRPHELAGQPPLGDGEGDPRRPLEELSNKVQRALLASTLEIQVPGPGAVREGAFFQRTEKRALPINLDLINWRAKRARRSGRAAEARALWRQAIEIDNRDGRAWIALSKDAERARRDPSLAASLLAESLRINPTSAHVRQAYGVLLERQGAWRRALGEYDRAIKGNPKHAASLVAKARLVVRHGIPGGPEAARLCYAQALAAEPRNAFAMLNWAELEAAEFGNATRARDLFRAAARANPRNAATFVSWAMFEERDMWKQQKAQTRGSSSLSKKNSSSEAAVPEEDALGTVRTLFRMATEAHPSNTRALTAWAGAELRAGDGTAARHLLERATRVESRARGGGCGDATVFCALGEVLWQTEGNAKKARDAFRRAVAVDATCVRTYDSWAKMELAVGDASRARELLQQGVWGCSSGIPDRAALSKLWIASGSLEFAAALNASDAGHEAKSVDAARPTTRSAARSAARSAFRTALDYATVPPALEPIAARCVLAWASLERELGETDRARALLEDRLAASPRDPRQLWKARLDLEPPESRAAMIIRQRAKANLEKLLLESGDAAFFDPRPANPQALLQDADLSDPVDDAFFFDTAKNSSSSNNNNNNNNNSNNMRQPPQRTPTTTTTTER